MPIFSLARVSSAGWRVRSRVRLSGGRMLTDSFVSAGRAWYYVRAPLYATGRLGPGNFARTQDMLAPNLAFPAIIAIFLEGLVGYMARLELH
jgi:hypothetical protein